MKLGREDTNFACQNLNKTNQTRNPLGQFTSPFRGKSRESYGQSVLLQSISLIADYAEPIEPYWSQMLWYIANLLIIVSQYQSVIWVLFLIQTWICLHMYQKLSSANYHLRNIGQMRKFLNTDTTKSAIVSLVTSHFGYCNGLLCGITDVLL